MTNESNKIKIIDFKTIQGGLHAHMKKLYMLIFALRSDIQVSNKLFALT